MAKGKLRPEETTGYQLAELREKAVNMNRHTLDDIIIHHVKGSAAYEKDLLRFLYKTRMRITMEPGIKEKPTTLKEGVYAILERDKRTIEYLHQKTHNVAILRGEVHDYSLRRFALRYKLPLKIEYIEKPIALPKGTPYMPLPPSAAIYQLILHNPKKYEVHIEKLERLLNNQASTESRVFLTLFERYPWLKKYPGLANRITGHLIKHYYKNLASHNKHSQKEFWSFVGKFLKEVQKKSGKDMSSGS